MPKLLLSVRSAGEAALALEAGVHLIDIKEPSSGALGAASPQTIAEIVRLAEGRAATSVACGELRESAAAVVGRLLGPDGALCDSPPHFIKVGLSGCGSKADWPQQWRNALAVVPNETTPVAVMYADWRLARAPSPTEVIQQAQALPRAAVLIDTFDKSGPGLLRLVPLGEVQALIERIHALQMQVAVSGQLTLDDAIAIAAFRPDYIGVRGGVCRGGRNGTIDAERVVQWRWAIKSLIDPAGV